MYLYVTLGFEELITASRNATGYLVYQFVMQYQCKSLLILKVQDRVISI